MLVSFILQISKWRQKEVSHELLKKIHPFSAFLSSVQLERQIGDFPDDPVDKTSSSQCRGPRFDA